MPLFQPEHSTLWVCTVLLGRRGDARGPGAHQGSRMRCWRLWAEPPKRALLAHTLRHPSRCKQGRPIHCLPPDPAFYSLTWRTFCPAQVVRSYGAEGCADITTRANLQIRGVTLQDADQIIDRLYELGLTSKQSGMDNGGRWKRRIGEGRPCTIVRLRLPRFEQEGMPRDSRSPLRSGCSPLCCI